MATSSANIGFEKQIWDAACVLWGHIPAADYRKVIVGLIFLRYIGSAFEKRYNELVAEGDGFEDDPDAYEEDNIFFVPKAARWQTISSAAHTPEIGTVIDDAMRAIEADNKKLKNVLPKNYASPDLDKRVLGDVVDLFTNMNMEDTEESKDLLGRTYEYCIAQFAAYEGVKGGEFYTPASIVKTIVAVLRPFSNCRVYDKRQAYLIQANGKRKSPKSLDTKGFGDCLLLGDSLLNGHFRRNRTTTAHQVYLRVQMKRKSFDSLGNRLTVCTRFFCDAGVFFSFDELVNKLYDEAGE